ncbi:MAG: hypothetical protein KGJ49_03635 [Alphaproteobacteria bacterium]|nr:hypothetical protein [Alphaproteobacteria bacterium]
MKMRTSLFSGIAFLAIASAAPALAQTDSAPPASTPDAAQTPSADQPAATPRHHRHHARSRQARSGPQYSTPEEQAATERLNEQQLQLAKAAPSASNTMAAQPPPADQPQPHR